MPKRDTEKGPAEPSVDREADELDIKQGSPTEESRCNVTKSLRCIDCISLLEVWRTISSFGIASNLFPSAQSSRDYAIIKELNLSYHVMGT